MTNMSAGTAGNYLNSVAALGFVPLSKARERASWSALAENARGDSPSPRVFLTLHACSPGPAGPQRGYGS